jgi:hypothetical protein
MNNKILFLTPARYPTEKAYGVTTGNTLEALSRLGASVEIWNRDYSGTDEYGNHLFQPGKKKLPKKRLLYRIDILGVSKWAYVLDQLKFGLSCKVALKKELGNVVVWTRFPLVALVASVSPNIELVVIELHHQPNFTSRLFLRGLGKLKRLKVAVISQKSKTQFDSLGLGIRTFTLEMSVPEKFIQSAIHPLTLPAKVCYLGKSKSSGNTNNLEFILSGYSQTKRASQSKLELVGVESLEASTLAVYAEKLRIPQSSIQFVSHIPHKEVDEYLNGASIGLVPYELNNYNSARFPIKILEYAAKGIWILAPESFAANLQIPPGVIITYKDADSTDFAKELDSLIEKLNLEPTRNSIAIEFAKLRTYSNRAQKYMEQIESNNLD